MKRFLLATTGMIFTLATAYAAPNLANGPEPYSAPTPESPIMQKAALPQTKTVPASLSQSSDSANAIAGGPEPYRAPNPAD